MNFLLHHDFAMRELSPTEARPIAAVGAMLPDLWRMADRRVRPKPRDLAFTADPTSDPGLSALLEGIEHHLQIDRWFHRSEGFVVGERALRSRFFETKTPKLLLFAHAAWEMCLDGALIRERGLATITESLREGLDGAAPHLGRAADLHHFDTTERDSNERARFDERMARIVRAGEDGGLYEDYLSTRGIARRLAGMRMAFGFAAPIELDVDAWTDALDEASKNADAALVRLRSQRAENLLEGERLVGN